MSRAPLWAGLVASLALALLLAPHSPAGAATARAELAIAAPGENTLVTGKRVRVTVRSTRPRFRVLIGTTEISSRFRRVRGDVYSAVLRRGSDLRPGSQRLVVEVGRGAGLRNVARDFVVGERRRGTLRVRREAGGRAALRVRIAGPRSSPYRSVSLRLNGKRVRTRDWVVGDRTASARWPLGKPAFDAMFGADNGLRFGSNRLSVTAWRGDGSFDRVTRSWRVSRSAPLVAAGTGAAASVRERVRLDGRATRRAPGSRGLRYRWRIVSRPDGSRAKLLGAASARPRVVPDRPGRYRLRLTATSGAGGAAAVDEATVEATPPTPPLGLPITALAGNGGVEIDGTAHPAPSGTDWAQLLVLDRKTLAVEGNRGFDFDPDGVEALLTALAGLDPSKLVVISGGGRAVSDPGECLDELSCRDSLGGAFFAAGAADQYDALESDVARWLSTLSSGNWSLVGVPGTAGSANTNLFGMSTGGTAGRQGSLVGYLRLDSHDNYGFVLPDTTTIDTNAPGVGAGVNRIRVGPDTYDSEKLAPAQGGFHVLVLDGKLDVTQHRTFALVPCCAPTVLAGIEEMAGMLRALPPGNLVVVQSIGAPYGVSSQWLADQALLSDSFGQNINTPVGNAESVWRSSAGGETLAAALGRLGGAEAHDQIAQMAGTQPQPQPPSRQGYTLLASAGMLNYDRTGRNLVPVVSGSAPVSRAQQLSDAGASRFTGTLSRDRQALWSADVGSSSADLGLEGGGIAPIVYQAPTAWPLSRTREQKATGAYIARRLGFHVSEGNVREAYYTDSGADWATKREQLEELRYPGKGRGFKAATFRALKKQLGREMPMVGNVTKLISDWQEVWTSSTVGNSLDLQSIAAEIVVEIEKLQQIHSSTARTEEIVSDSLWIASALAAPVPGVDAALAVGAASADLAASTANTATGAPSTLPVEAEASKLGAELAGRYEAIESNLSQLGEILVSDWGKLQRASKESAGAWAFDTEVRDALVETLTVSAKREFYRALLAAAYRLYVVDPPWVMKEDPRQSHIPPQQIQCESDSQVNPTTRPLDDAAYNPSSWMARQIGFLDLTSRQVWVGLSTEASLGRKGEMTTNPHTLPEAISAPLFQPLETSQSGALGIDKVSFFADPRFDRYWFWCKLF